MNKAPYALFSLSILALILLLTCEAKADVYIKIGTGYKLIEPNHIIMESGEKVYYDTGSKISARIEIGVEKGNWSYGLSHHSQWLDGEPFNDKPEPHKTEIFIDYKWTL